MDSPQARCLVRVLPQLEWFRINVVCLSGDVKLPLDLVNTELLGISVCELNVELFVK
jgi:hypothetical protein